MALLRVGMGLDRDISAEAQDLHLEIEVTGVRKASATRQSFWRMADSGHPATF